MPAVSCLLGRLPLKVFSLIQNDRNGNIQIPQQDNMLTLLNTLNAYVAGENMPTAFLNILLLTVMDP